MSADFAIGQFRFLVPLLLIHGRYSYRRITKLIMYSFYKNIIVVICQFWYTFFSGYSGQTLFEQYTLGVYNIIFTGLPIITFAILDEDVSRKNILQNPQLYVDGQKNTLFTPLQFLGWLGTSIYQSAIIFFFVMQAYSNSNTYSDGTISGLWDMGFVMYICVLIIVTLKLALESRRWVWFHHLVLWGCLFMVFVWGVVYSILYPGVGIGEEMYYVYYRLLGNATHWFCVIGVPIAAMLLPFTWLYIRRTFFPRNYHIVAEREKLGKLSKLNRKKKPLERRHLTIRGAKVQNQRTYTGFAFTEGLPASVVQSTQK